MEPGQAIALADVQADMMDLRVALKRRGNSLPKEVHAPSAQRRNRNNIVTTLRFGQQRLPVGFAEQIHLVPGLQPWRPLSLANSKRYKNVLNILGLRITIRMGHVANVDQKIGGRDFFESRPAGLSLIHISEPTR